MRLIITFFALIQMACAGDFNLTLNSPVQIQHLNTGNNMQRIVHVCVLRPFTKIYAQADLTQAMAKEKVSRACQAERGKNSLFCEPEKAECSISEMGMIQAGFSDDKNNALMLYNGINQSGRALLITSNTEDLNRYQFNDQLASYYIPPGWEVRFYKDKGYQGDYYTRKSGYGSAVEFSNSISSVQILKKP